MENIWCVGFFCLNNCCSDLCQGWFGILQIPLLPQTESLLCSLFPRYNNKTYRIDDIKWDVFPTHTFHGRFKGVERDISYVEYYQEVLLFLLKPLITYSFSLKIQWSSELCELCIRVLYAHILRVRVCQYAHKRGICKL